MPHAVGTTLWPALRTASTKPEMPIFSPPIVASMASPSLAPGQAPVRAKSSQVVGWSTKVVLSCMKPPTAMRNAMNAMLRPVCA